MTDVAADRDKNRIPASLQRRPAASTSPAKILALAASVAVGVSLVGAMAVSAQPDAAIPAPQEQVIVVRIETPVTPSSSTTAAPVPVLETAPTTVAPVPTTVSEGS